MCIVVVCGPTEASGSSVDWGDGEQDGERDCAKGGGKTRNHGRLYILKNVTRNERTPAVKGRCKKDGIKSVKRT